MTDDKGFCRNLITLNNLMDIIKPTGDHWAKTGPANQFENVCGPNFSLDWGHHLSELFVSVLSNSDGN